MWSSHCLRWRIPRVPLVLVPGMQNKPRIAGGVGTDQTAAIHHAGNSFQTFADFDLIDAGRDGRKGAQHFVWSQSLLERSVALRIESLCVGHAPAHPQHDERVRSWFALF